MKTCLITGGLGFIGYHLGKALVHEGYQIILVDNMARGVLDEDAKELLANEHVEIIEADLLKSDEVNNLPSAGIDYVFHFAAIIGVQHVLKRPYAVLTKNVRMLDLMLQWAKNLNNLERFVFASTSEVTAGALRFYDAKIPTPESIPLSITPVAEPRTSYMLSKIYGEAMCMHSGVPCTVMRPHNIYGPRMGMSHVIPELLKKSLALAEGMPLEVYSTGHSRAFCYIDDAVHLLRLIISTQEACGQILNLGNGSEEVNMRRVAECVLESVGLKRTIKPLPATPGSPQRRCPDMSRVRELTGFYAKISLNEGIRKTYAWYDANVFNATDKETAI